MGFLLTSIIASLRGMKMSEQTPNTLQLLVENIKLRGFDDQYIDLSEEKEILQQAVQNGITVASARQSLAQTCDECGYVLESRAREAIKDILATFAENDGKVDEKEYNDAVTIAKKQTKGKKSEVECKCIVLQIIKDNSYKPKTGLIFNWFKRELGAVGM